MSAISELINQLCPNGVEYKKLGEVFDFYNGYTPSKSNGDFWTNGSIPWFRLDDIRENGRILADSIQHVSRGAVKGELFPADSLIVSTSATIGEYALITAPAITNQRFVVLHPKNEYEGMIDSHFLLYVGSEIGLYCKKNTNQGNFASVDMGAFRRFQIPVPPLPVQQEIVRRLDAITGLIEDLEKELAARQKQYEWVREETFKQLEAEGVERKKLGEMVSVKSAPLKVNRTEYCKTGIYPIVDQGQSFIAGYTDDEEAVIAGGPYVIFGDHTREVKYVDFPFAQGADGVKILCPKNGVDARYLYYAVSVLKIKSRGYNRHWPIASKLDILLPISPVQQQIVRRLDEMTELIAAIEKEIALRKKQYEYCREKLLTFRRAG